MCTYIQKSRKLQKLVFKITKSLTCFIFVLKSLSIKNKKIKSSEKKINKISKKWCLRTTLVEKQLRLTASTKSKLRKNNKIIFIFN